MSSTVSFKDHSEAWLRVQKMNLSNALDAMADAIMKNAIVTAPKLNGDLRNSSHVVKEADNARSVRFSTPYAAYQERGMRADGTHVVRNYTTPGTGAHYLENSAKTAVKAGIGVYL